MRLSVSEEQNPQVIGKTEKMRYGMDGLQGNFTRPRQVAHAHTLHTKLLGRVRTVTGWRSNQLIRANQCQMVMAFEKGFVAGLGILAQRSVSG